jgi:hypothetical protein
VAGLHAGLSGEGDVAEEHGAVGRDRDAFGEMAARKNLFQLGPGGEDLRSELGDGEYQQEAEG